MTSTGTDQRAYQMFMRKGDPGYSVSPKRTLFGESGQGLRRGRNPNSRCLPQFASATET